MPAIFQFSKGARAGEFFHAVLEELDFQQPEQLSHLIPQKLALYGFGGSVFKDALIEKLHDLLELELQPGLRLSDITLGQRLSEVDFLCRLHGLAPQSLRELFADYPDDAVDPEGLGRLRFSKVSGFLSGVIDLLFEHEGKYYIIDWKSNWLGDVPEAYDAAGVAAAMRQHHYALQAHLYVLASDRFLSRRLAGYRYEEHFGGFFYLFLRGIDPKTPSRGVYFHRPSLETVEMLRTFTEEGNRKGV